MDDALAQGFRLTLTHQGQTYTTALIAGNASAAQVQTAVNAAFGPIAKKVIYIDSDGPIPRDYRKIPFTRIQRPIYPLDAVTNPGLIF